MGLIEEVGVYLARADTLALVPGTSLFYGSRPDFPDQVLTIYEYTGGAPEFDHGSTLPEWESPRLQLVARAVDPLDARNLARNAYLALSVVCAHGNATLPDDAVPPRFTTYRSLRPLQQPFQMGFDENRRALWVVNFDCVRRPLPDN